jgi:hypothetical protein
MFLMPIDIAIDEAGWILRLNKDETCSLISAFNGETTTGLLAAASPAIESTRSCQSLSG